MIYASLIVEAVRARPATVFWLAALTQAALWFAVPTALFSAPPGSLAETIAIGREMRLGSAYGPPLAYWLAEIGYRLAGQRLAGVYLLSQVCVVLALWSLFALGRELVGSRHAALAALLLVGIAAVTVATPEFGPAVLLMPLWGLTLFAAWRAMAAGQPAAWLALGLLVGLLVLTSLLALLLVGLLALFVLAAPIGRARLRTADPWLAGATAALLALPFGVWLGRRMDLVEAAIAAVQAAAPSPVALAWLRLLAMTLVAHAGAIVLIVLASGWPFERRRVAAVEGIPAPPLAAWYVGCFALAPVLLGALALAVLAPSPTLVDLAPLVLLSGLAAVLAAGPRIRLHRQILLAYAWLGLLFAPPIILALGVTVLPRLLPIELRIAQPATPMAQYFSDVFARRTGQPLTIVAGERRLAALIALAAPSRPRLYIDARTTGWLAPEEIRRHGAVIVWPAHDTAGTPPPELQARFPDIVPEVPRLFERPLHGFGAALRVGWAVIRPAPASGLETLGQP